MGDFLFSCTFSMRSPIIFLSHCLVFLRITRPLDLGYGGYSYTTFFFTGTISHFNIWRQWKKISKEFYSSASNSSCSSGEFGDLIDWRLLKSGARGDVQTIKPDNCSRKCLKTKRCLNLSFHICFFVIVFITTT